MPITKLKTAPQNSLAGTKKVQLCYSLRKQRITTARICSLLLPCLKSLLRINFNLTDLLRYILHELKNPTGKQGFVESLVPPAFQFCALYITM